MKKSKQKVNKRDKSIELNYKREINLLTKSIPSAKIYNRKKLKKDVYEF